MVYKKIIKSLTFKDLLSNLMNIVLSQTEYHEIFDNLIQKLYFIHDKKVKITLYELKEPINIDIIDFNQGELLYNYGYNLSNLNIQIFQNY